MKDINTLKNKLNITTAHLILLTIVTAGIYPIMWLYKNQSVITEETNNAFVTFQFPIWLAVFVGLSWLLPTLSPEYYRNSMSGMEVLSSLLSLGTVVMYVIWGFRARTALQRYALNEFKFELKMNAFYTVVFNLYYIVYCINHISDDFAKHKILQEAFKTTEQV